MSKNDPEVVHLVDRWCRADELHGSARLQKKRAAQEVSSSAVSRWESGSLASELKSVTQTAMQQTKEAVIGEAKIVAKDMVDLKDGVAEGMRLTVQDSHLLRERLQQQTRKVFHREESSSAGATSTSSTEKRPIGFGLVSR
ncbi:unnamed protein product [Durusdinium trenchii]|uniref:Uncharacterized protein n=1 Tax=Durusdinium trenchii TaxID=1381693 RepID=A0ABP0HYB9_9DINO